MADLVTEWFMEPSVRTNYRTMVYYKGDGQDTFEINFDGGFIYKEDVKAFSVKDGTRERKNHKVTFVNGSVSRVKLDSVIPKGWTVCIYRDTPKAKPLAQFTDGAIINEANLDRNAQQAMFAVSEMVDRFDSTVESVEAALQQVYEANKKADQAINTANGAKATANNAVGIANGAVKTANEAKQSADNANTTANSAVNTANEAKSIAQGLDGQIKQANTTANNAVTKADSAITTANEAKTTANGIDAKATKALNDSAQALIVANGIDGKATQALTNSTEALDKADTALESQGVAKQLTDRVSGYPSAIDVRWKGTHNFNRGVNVENSNDGVDGRAYFQLFTPKELRMGITVDGKYRHLSYSWESQELYTPHGVVYRANSLDPIFRSTVRVERPDGYYSRFRLQNGSNGDRVELIHDSTNKPQLISTKGSNGSTAYTWSFPSSSGTLANENFVNDKVNGRLTQSQGDARYALNNFYEAIGGESRMWNGAKNRFLVVNNNLNSGLYNPAGADYVWGFNSTGQMIAGLVPISCGGTGAKDIGTARNNLQVYSKSESDSRYMKKGSSSTWTKIGDFQGDAAPTETRVTENILGRLIFIQRNSHDAYIAVNVPPVPNILFVTSVHGDGYWEFQVSSDGKTLKMPGGKYSSVRGVYIVG